MPCNCGKKNIGHYTEDQSTDPLKWGPILWKYLHSLAEHVGFSGNSIVDTDQANYMETIISILMLLNRLLMEERFSKKPKLLLCRMEITMRPILSIQSIPLYLEQIRTIRRLIQPVYLIIYRFD